MVPYFDTIKFFSKRTLYSVILVKLAYANNGAIKCFFLMSFEYFTEVQFFFFHNYSLNSSFIIRNIININKTNAPIIDNIQIINLNPIIYHNKRNTSKQKSFLYCIVYYIIVHLLGFEPRTYRFYIP